MINNYVNIDTQVISDTQVDESVTVQRFFALKCLPLQPFESKRHPKNPNPLLLLLKTTRSYVEGSKLSG